jgi:hypothetical protein
MAEKKVVTNLFKVRQNLSYYKVNLKNATEAYPPYSGSLKSKVNKGRECLAHTSLYV